jgi:hypothetical protein
VAAVSPSGASVPFFLLAHRPDRFRFFTDFLLAAHTECSLAFLCSPALGGSKELGMLAVAVGALHKRKIRVDRLFASVNNSLRYAAFPDAARRRRISS